MLFILIGMKAGKRLIILLQLDEQMVIGKISKGQRAKAKLLLVLSRRPPYLLLDGLFSGIDLLTREEIANALIEGYRRRTDHDNLYS